MLRPRGRAGACCQGEPRSRSSYVPLLVGGEPIGVISLQNLDREHAFSDADMRAADDPRGEPQRRPRERPPHRRDAAARRGAGDRQQTSARRSPRSSTSTRSSSQLGDQMRDDVRGRHRVRRAARPGERTYRVRRTTARAASHEPQEPIPLGDGPHLPDPRDRARASCVNDVNRRSARVQIAGTATTPASAYWARRSSAGDGVIGMIGVWRTTDERPVHATPTSTSWSACRQQAASRSRTPGCSRTRARRAQGGRAGEPGEERRSWPP